jgi:hypothetical protein
MGTGVLDSNFIPNILKSFWNPRESEAYRKLGYLQVLLEKREIWNRTNKTKDRQDCQQVTYPDREHRTTCFAPAFTASYARSMPVSPLPRIMTRRPVS